MNRLRFAPLLALALVLSFSLSACAAASRTFFAMDTVMTVSAPSAGVALSNLMLAHVGDAAPGPTANAVSPATVTAVSAVGTAPSSALPYTFVQAQFAASAQSSGLTPRPVYVAVAGVVSLATYASSETHRTQPRRALRTLRRPSAADKANPKRKATPFLPP